jgi:hypothetical protein
MKKRACPKGAGRSVAEYKFKEEIEDQFEKVKNS